MHEYSYKKTWYICYKKKTLIYSVTYILYFLQHGDIINIGVTVFLNVCSQSIPLFDSFLPAWKLLSDCYFYCFFLNAFSVGFATGTGYLVSFDFYFCCHCSFRKCIWVIIVERLTCCSHFCKFFWCVLLDKISYF